MESSSLEADGQVQTIRDRPVRPREVADRVLITRHTMDGASLVQIVGDVDLDVVTHLRAVLDAAVGAHAWVIVDLSRARTIDSVGLSVLVAAGHAARRKGGELLLAAPPSFLQTVLRSTRMATTFPVHDNVPRAMTAALLGRKASPVVPQARRPGDVTR